MIHYIGLIQTNGERVVRRVSNATSVPVEPRRDLVDYGDVGFTWGNRSSGAAALALALIAAQTVGDVCAMQYHRGLRDEIIATWPEDMGWMFSTLELKWWLHCQAKAVDRRLNTMFLMRARLASWNAHG